MSRRVTLNLKVDALTKARIEKCAKQDRRTVSAYIEGFVDRDAKERKVVLSDEEIAEIESGVPVALRREKVVFDPLSMELPHEVDSEEWVAWIEYRRLMKLSVHEPVLRSQVKKLEKGIQEGYDVNAALRRAMDSGWKMFFFDERDKEDEPEETVAQRLHREMNESLHRSL